jgi:acetyl esterase/lipase
VGDGTVLAGRDGLGVLRRGVDQDERDGGVPPLPHVDGPASVAGQVAHDPLAQLLVIPDRGWYDVVQGRVLAHLGSSRASPSTVPGAVGSDVGHRQRLWHPPVVDITDLRPPVASGPFPPQTHLPPVSSRGVAGARSWTGLSYACVRGHRPMVLDLHVPAAATGPVPLVVWIHGGGWMEGDRRYVPLQWPQQRVFEKVVAAGMAVATVDYRLLGDAPFPACVHDCVAAVRYLRRYADELGLDPARVAVWGESAGAHLASMVAFLGSAPRADERLLGTIGVGTGRVDVAAAVLFYGPATLDWVVGQAATADVRAAFGGEPSLGTALSPASHVHPGIPPVLLMHGRDDGLVPVGESERLHAALREAGVDSTLEVTDRADHCFVGAPVEPHLDRAVEFLARHLH